MSDGYIVDPGELGRAGETLGTVAGTVEQQAGAARVRPDAGQSSGEVANAFGRLAGELQAFSRAVSHLAGDVQGARATYQETDRNAADQYRGAVRR